MDLLVTYDIHTVTGRDQRRLAKVAEICERYGQRAQYSVFECRVSENSYVRLVAELSDVIDLSRDSINVYRLQGGVEQCRTSLGRREGHALGQPWFE
jgi:CRISPR-associated protein Cas2